VNRDGVPERAPFTTHALNGASLVRLAGDIDLDVVPALRTALQSALAAHAWVIVDLSQVRIVDSVGLSVLVTAGFAARRNGGDLLMAAPPSFLLSVLHSARPATQFSVYDTVPRAMTAALLRSSAPLGKKVLTGQRAESYR
jgi:anti-anti-sigma factor